MASIFLSPVLWESDSNIKLDKARTFASSYFGSFFESADIVPQPPNGFPCIKITLKSPSVAQIILRDTPAIVCAFSLIFLLLMNF